MVDVVLTNIREMLFQTEIVSTLMAVVLYAVLGYFACAFIVKDFEYANGIPRMAVFALLLGWAAIPIALVLLVFRACKLFFGWLFEI